MGTLSPAVTLWKAVQFSSCFSQVASPLLKLPRVSLHHVLLFLDAASLQAVDPQIKQSYGVSQCYGDFWRFSPELRSDGS